MNLIQLNYNTFNKLKNNVAITEATKDINWDEVETYSKYEEDISEDVFPRIYQMELTNTCNLKCIMCPYPQMTRPKAMMTAEMAKKILDNGVLFPQTIELQMFGESTINKDLGKIVELIKAKGCKASLSTNATLLHHDDICRELMGLDAIVLSIDGATKETYERVRGASFEHIINCVKNFMKVRSTYEIKPYVAIQIISMSHTEQDKAEYMNFWESFGADEIRVKYLLDSFGGVTMTDEVKKQTGCRRACTEAMSGVSVRADGSVSPCCRDFDGKMSFGNLVTTPIIEIWNSPQAKKFREAHISGDVSNYPLCAGCNEWNLVNLRFLPNLALTHFKGADIRVEDLYEKQEDF